MVLGDVEETITAVEIDEETYEEVYKVIKKKKKTGILLICFSMKFS